MPKKHWIIDWRIEGSIEIMADDAAKAQAIFDEGFGSPNLVDPLRDGEVSNDEPYLNDAGRSGGRRNADPA